MKRILAGGQVSHLRINLSAETDMKKLKAKGFIDEDDNKFLCLTERGTQIITRVTASHRLLENFLIEVLGVNKVLAEIDACKIAHLLSEETREKLADFMAAPSTTHTAAVADRE